MPHFHEPVAAACINVDLVQSTKDCLHYLYPLTTSRRRYLLARRAFPLDHRVLRDDAFWEHEIGIKKPAMEGLGLFKLVAIPHA